MSVWMLFVLAVGLSMDAFAVAVCKGLSIQKLRWKDCAIVGLYFGIFQAGMPVIGYLLGVQFQSKIENIDHWIAFVLLSLIGACMIKESFEKDDVKSNADLDFKSMIVLAIATSIDALAVGVSLAFLRVSIIPAVTFIGIVTFVLSFVGVKIGHIFGSKYKAKAEFAGGVILILIGTKILLEHLGVL
ncbi:MAG: manganese efflux pump [Clostridia bacterium]|nr:manganese efflux pump [Clostridia bacterium]